MSHPSLFSSVQRSFVFCDYSTNHGHDHHHDHNEPLAVLRLPKNPPPFCLAKVRRDAPADTPGALEGRNAIKETWQQELARSLGGE